MKSQYDEIIAKASETFRLDANLIRAIVTTESSWNTLATRFEKDWHLFNRVQDFASKLGINRYIEEKNQATSWGLMQVMGAVARDLGFTDDLTLLLTPDIGVFYGCKKLRQLYNKYEDEEKVVSAYNAGTPRMVNGMYSNQRYVDRVYSYLRALRALV